MKMFERELKEIAHRRLLRAQMREEVITESVNAITAQRNSIRMEVRGLTLMAKKV